MDQVTPELPPYVKEVPAPPITVLPWGKGVYDLRLFHGNPLMPGEGTDNFSQFNSSYFKQYPHQFSTAESALGSIQRAIDTGEPGLYFVGHPFYGNYGKWTLLLAKWGFQVLPVCGWNRVYGTGGEDLEKPGLWSKGKQGFTYADRAGKKNVSKTPWESSDCREHWAHALYFVKPGFTGEISFDFSKRNANASSGDDLNSLWQINYALRHSPPPGSPWDKNPAYCPKFARLSKNCGIAFGEGLPECGKFLDEEYFTIAALPTAEKFPEGWQVFLEFGGKNFAHNIAKLDTANNPCPHLEQIRSL